MTNMRDKYLAAQGIGEAGHHDDAPPAEYEVWVTVLRMDGATGDVDEHTSTAEGNSLPDALTTASRKALEGVLKHA